MLLSELPIIPVLFYHQHHADELFLPWTRRGVSRAAKLIREGDDFQAPMLALARWLEHAPAEHGALLADAALGRLDAPGWTRASIRPCSACGFPPMVRTHDEAISRFLFPEPTLGSAHDRSPELEKQLHEIDI